jgi:F420-non-reducing hydrogenase iron-sulfur subunit
MKNYEPKLVCFSCKFGWGFLGDENAMVSKIKNWIPVVCSGKVDTSHILEAFRAGADGVLILGCPEGHCHFQDGNYQTSKKVYLLQKVLEAYGIEQKRVKMKFSLDPEGKKIPQLINELKEGIKSLGPLKGFEHWKTGVGKDQFPGAEK